MQKYESLFKDHYQGKEDSQKSAITTVLKCFGQLDSSSSNFSLFNQTKALLVLEKLYHLELLSSKVIIAYCVE